MRQPQLLLLSTATVATVAAAVSSFANSLESSSSGGGNENYSVLGPLEGAAAALTSSSLDWSLKGGGGFGHTTISQQSSYEEEELEGEGEDNSLFFESNRAEKEPFLEGAELHSSESKENVPPPAPVSTGKMTRSFPSAPDLGQENWPGEHIRRLLQETRVRSNSFSAEAVTRPAACRSPPSAALRSASNRNQSPLLQPFQQPQPQQQQQPVEQVVAVERQSEAVVRFDLSVTIAPYHDRSESSDGSVQSDYSAERRGVVDTDTGAVDGTDKAEEAEVESANASASEIENANLSASASEVESENDSGSESGSDESGSENDSESGESDDSDETASDDSDSEDSDSDDDEDKQSSIFARIVKRCPPEESRHIFHNIISFLDRSEYSNIFPTSADERLPAAAWACPVFSTALLSYRVSIVNVLDDRCVPALQESFEVPKDKPSNIGIFVYHQLIQSGMDEAVFILNQLHYLFEWVLYKGLRDGQQLQTMDDLFNVLLLATFDAPQPTWEMQRRALADFRAIREALLATAIRWDCRLQLETLAKMAVAVVFIGFHDAAKAAGRRVQLQQEQGGLVTVAVAMRRLLLTDNAAPLKRIVQDRLRKLSILARLSLNTIRDELCVLRFPNAFVLLALLALTLRCGQCVLGFLLEMVLWLGAFVSAVLKIIKSLI